MVVAITSPVVAAPHHRGTTTPKPAPAPAVSNDTPDLPGASTHSEGEYGGVSPDHPGKPDPNQKPKKPPAPGTLSWIGFEAKAGGAEIFLQAVAAFELSQHVEGSTLVVDTPLARLGQNTWRDVDTRFFDSPIAHIVAKHVGAARATKTSPAHGAGVEVRVVFKNAKDAHEAAVRSATEADGLYYAYLSFAGSAAADSQPSMADPEK
jgi:hypothetical protein